jgi:hypothetical protein
LPILADRGVRAGTIPKKGKKLGYFYKVSFSCSMLKGTRKPRGEKVKGRRLENRERED